MGSDEIGHLPARGEQEGRGVEEALSVRQSPPAVAHQHAEEGESRHVQCIGVGAERDVVAEHPCQFVGVRVTSDPGHQVRVEDDVPLVGAQLHPVGHARGDHRRAQHVLHRLTETQIDREGQRGDQLRPSRTVTRGRHGLSVLARCPVRKMRQRPHDVRTP